MTGAVLIINKDTLLRIRPCSVSFFALPSLKALLIESEIPERSVHYEKPNQHHSRSRPKGGPLLPIRLQAAVDRWLLGTALASAADLPLTVANPARCFRTASDMLPAALSSKAQVCGLGYWSAAAVCGWAVGAGLVSSASVYSFLCSCSRWCGGRRSSPSQSASNRSAYYWAGKYDVSCIMLDTYADVVCNPFHNL